MIKTQQNDWRSRHENKELPDNNQKLNVNSSWVKVGVVVKTTRGDSYMAVAFQINNPNYGK